MNSIQRLLPRHYGLLRLVITGAHTMEQMAQMMGYTPEGLRNVVKSPLFQDELARRRAVVERSENVAIADGLTMAQDLLKKTAVAAVEKMEEVMATSADHKIQLDAADKILKYAFPKDVIKGGNAQTTVVVLDSAKLDRLREALNEAGLSTEKAPPPLQTSQDEAGTFQVTGLGL